MRGIVLSGGSGTRLMPATAGISKQMIPVYDKPMVYYALSTLITAGIQNIVIITTTRDAEVFQAVLGDGAKFGVNLSYAQQPRPGGLAEAFLLDGVGIANHDVALVLGDNIFSGPDLSRALIPSPNNAGATVFAIRVDDPSAFGVVEFDEAGTVISLEEKPAHPKSRFAVPGLYYFDAEVVERAGGLERSARGELEITDLNRTYLADGRLSVRVLPPGIAWFDTGTVENLHEASHYVRGVQVHRGIPVGSPEYSAWKSGFLTKQEFEQRAEQLVKSAYGQLLLSCLEGGPEPGLLQGARAQERAAASVTERVLDALPSVVAHDSSR